MNNQPTIRNNNKFPRILIITNLNRKQNKILKT